MKKSSIVVEEPSDPGELIEVCLNLSWEGGLRINYEFLVNHDDFHEAEDKDEFIMSELRKYMTYAEKMHNPNGA